MGSNIKSIEKIADRNILLTVNSSTKSMEQMAVILKYLVINNDILLIKLIDNQGDEIFL